MKKDNFKLKDELRHMLLIYAFYPFAFFVIFVILALYIIFINMPKNNLICYADTINKHINGIDSNNELFIDNYVIDIDEYMKNPTYRADIHALAYQFYVESGRNTYVFIADKNKNMLFCTKSDTILTAKLYESIKWEIDKADGQKFLLRRNVLQDIYSYFITSKKHKDYYVVLASSDDSFAKVQNKYSVLITDKYNNILFCNNPLLEKTFGKGYVINKFEPQIIDIGGKKYWYLNSNNKSGLVLTLLYDLNESINSIRNIIVFMLLSFIIITISIFISTKIFSDKKTKTINQIINFFSNKENNNKKLIVESNDEYSIIADKYNIMLDYQQKLSQRNNEIIKETHIAKIKQLESEFNPHFLFNTLENIRFMTKLNPSAAEQMIVYLSKLLRYSISNKDFVSLKDDLSYTKYYLELLKFRFHDKINYSIDGFGFNYFVPKLVMQPIIENSVKYSLDKKDSLNIKISIFEQNNYVYISVVDDGIGIESDKLRKLMLSIKNKTYDSHIGLTNLNYRLQLIYGDNSGLCINSKDGEFTEVIVKIPLENNAYTSYS